MYANIAHAIKDIAFHRYETSERGKNVDLTFNCSISLCASSLNDAGNLQREIEANHKMYSKRREFGSSFLPNLKRFDAFIISIVYILSN